jgi:hypothetical protein
MSSITVTRIDDNQDVAIPMPEELWTSLRRLSWRAFWLSSQAVSVATTMSSTRPVSLVGSRPAYRLTYQAMSNY